MLFLQKSEKSPWLHQFIDCTTKPLELAFALPDHIDSLTLNCDLIEAQDGGISFLHIYDIMEVSSSNESCNWVVKAGYLDRYAFLMNFFRDHYDHNSASSELRVLVPMLYPAHDMITLYQTVFLNSYGLLRGFRFVDERPRRVTRYSNRDCLIKRTALPDVYSVQPAAGDGDSKVLYVGGKIEAERLNDMMGMEEEKVILCAWDIMRQKWRIASNGK